MDLDKLHALIWSCLNNVCASLDETLDEMGITPDEVLLERPKSRDHGDWSTNLALKLGKKLGYNNPRELAELVANALTSQDGIESVSIAGPGFINITLNTADAANIIKKVLVSGIDYGRSDTLGYKLINLEFVSANPTGPLHIGGVRWAAVGDALARILQFSGAKVEREYYFNDHGEQINRFARSLYAAANGLATPEDGYAGSYINDIAGAVIKECGLNASEEDFRRVGVQIMFPLIKQSLEDFGVHFDRFFHEQSLYDDGKVDAAIARLRESGDVYDKDGATWIATSKYGDDKDRVIIKSNGEEAYFAADVAYYLDKRSRADQAIYMLGADHGGYIGRLYAVAQAFGDKVHDNIEIMIGQLVNLKKDGEPVRMSKRAGNIITIDDLVDAVGVDAARYSLTRSSTDSPLELDLDLLSSHKLDNPVYYVQYAYARTCNVLRNFEAVQGEVMLDKTTIDGADLSLLIEDSEEEIISKLVIFPEIVKKSATGLEPHRVARYLEELAGAYHSWYASCRVVGENVAPELSQARIYLNLAVKQVLANGLNLLGVAAPERM